MASWVSSKVPASLHGKYFKVLVKLSHFRHFLLNYACESRKQYFESIGLRLVNKILKNIIELLIDDFNLANKLDYYICKPSIVILSQQTQLNDLDLETCIIHYSGDESLLISPEDLDSWKSLLKASTVRNDLTPRNEKSPMSVIIGHTAIFL